MGIECGEHPLNGAGKKFLCIHLVNVVFFDNGDNVFQELQLVLLLDSGFLPMLAPSTLA